MKVAGCVGLADPVFFNSIFKLIQTKPIANFAERVYSLIFYVFITLFTDWIRVLQYLDFSCNEQSSVQVDDDLP